MLGEIRFELIFDGNLEGRGAGGGSSNLGERARAGVGEEETRIGQE